MTKRNNTPSQPKRSRPSPAEQVRQGKAFRALVDRAGGPNCASLHRAGIEAAASALTLQIALGEEYGFHYPREIRKLLGDVSGSLALFSIAAREDEELRSKLIHSGMVRLGLRKKPAVA